MLAYDIFPTPDGPAAVVLGPRGLLRVVLPGRSGAALRRILGRDHPGARRDPAACRAAARWVRAALRGGAGSYPGRIDASEWSGFQRRLYASLRRVRAGGTTTYGELARRAGSPGGARAAGRALGANPAPLAVPCHRVVAGDGSLGGFSAAGGTAFKAILLRREGVESVH